MGSLELAPGTAQAGLCAKGSPWPVGAGPVRAGTEGPPWVALAAFSRAPSASRGHLMRPCAFFPSRQLSLERYPRDLRSDSVRS